MNPITRFIRLFHISYVLLKHQLDEIILATHLLGPLRFLVLFSPFRYLPQAKKPRGVRIREALEELGPIFVKFGQLLSTRPDIIPEDIIKELVRLQDKVPPFQGILAKKIIEEALGSSVIYLFQEFDPDPLASASIAQVHAVTLLDGRKAIVKVLRPHIHKIIRRDVALLKTMASLAHRYSKIARHFKPKEVIAEFEKVLNNELDLMQEAANASQLRRNFLHSSELYIPEIFWELTHSNVLVMERIYGIPIYDFDLLRQSGFDFKQLAEQLIEIFFTQVFRDCFFHADIHPGNIFVSPQNPKKPLFIAVDFGIMGSLDTKDQRYLAENLLAFFKRDYRRVSELHLESGWIPHTTRIDEFEAAIRAVCEPIFERPVKEISVGKLLLRLFQTAAHFHVNIQPQLILLQKTILTVEGLGRELYPELDLWKTSHPFLEKWVKTQMGPRAFLKKLKLYGPFWLDKLPELPNLIYEALVNASQIDVSHFRTFQSHDPGGRHYHLNPQYSNPHHSKASTNLSRFSMIDICLGILFGISLSIIVLFARSYFR